MWLREIYVDEYNEWVWMVCGLRNNKSCGHGIYSGSIPQWKRIETG
jgi:hypothetical protein